MPRDPVCQRWLITGTVQGVGYRAWMAAEARGCGVDGWVRNLADGRVEALVRGDAGILAALHRSCLSGPPGARVRQIEAREWDPAEVSAGFQAR